MILSIVQESCPVTKGKPTSMTEDGFKRQCRHNRTLRTATGMYVDKVCFNCDQSLPAELTIFELPKTRINMGKTARVHGQECEVCGQTKDLSSNYGKLVCSTCSVVRGVAKKRPIVLMDCLREFDLIVKNLLPHEIEQVKAMPGETIFPATDSVAYGIRLRDKVLEEKDQKITELTQEIAAWEEVEQSLTERIGQLSADYLKDLEELQRQMDVKDAKIDDLEETVAMKESCITQLQNVVFNATEEVKGYVDKIEMVERENDKLIEMASISSASSPFVVHVPDFKLQPEINSPFGNTAKAIREISWQLAFLIIDGVGVKAAKRLIAVDREKLYDILCLSRSVADQAGE